MLSSTKHRTLKPHVRSTSSMVFKRFRWSFQQTVSEHAEDRFTMIKIAIMVALVGALHAKPMTKSQGASKPRLDMSLTKDRTNMNQACNTKAQQQADKEKRDNYWYYDGTLMGENNGVFASQDYGFHYVTMDIDSSYWEYEDELSDKEEDKKMKNGQKKKQEGEKNKEEGQSKRMVARRALKKKPRN